MALPSNTTSRTKLRPEFDEVLSYSKEEAYKKLKNLNDAVNDNGTLDIPGLESLNYFIQTFTIPSINIPSVEVNYLGNIMGVPGDAITYGELVADVIVDEDLSNYLALFEWIKRQAHKDDVLDRMVTINILWRNRNHDVTRRLIMNSAFITDLGSFSIVCNNLDQDILVCPVTFKFQYMTIENLTLPPERTVDVIDGKDGHYIHNPNDDWKK